MCSILYYNRCHARSDWQNTRIMAQISQYWVCAGGKEVHLLPWFIKWPGSGLRQLFSFIGDTGSFLIPETNIGSKNCITSKQVFVNASYFFCISECIRKLTKLLYDSINYIHVTLNKILFVCGVYNKVWFLLIFFFVLNLLGIWFLH